MALGPGQGGRTFAGAVGRQGYVRPRDGAVASYVREFRCVPDSRRCGRMIHDSEVDLFLTVSKAKRVMTVAIHNPPRPAPLRREFKRETGFTATYVRASSADRLAYQAFAREVRVGTRVGEFQLFVIHVRVSRVLGIVAAVGGPDLKLRRSDAPASRASRPGASPSASARSTSRRLRSRARQPSARRSKATRGTWKNSPTTFAFKWWHCNPRADFRHPCRVILGASQDT
jgi:hypothetical protein